MPKLIWKHRKIATRSKTSRRIKVNGYFTLTSAALLLSIGSVAHGATYSRSDITPALGQGYDSVTGQLRGPCAALRSSSRETADTRAEYAVNHVTDAYQLSSLTQVGLAFSYKAASGSGNGSLNWLESQALSSFVETFLVRGTFQRSVVSADFELKKEFKKLRVQDPLQFRKVCGDSFIASYKLGALIQGTITFKANSDEKSRDIRLSAGVDGAGSSASSSGLLQVASSSDSKAVSIRGETVGIGKPFPSTGAELINDVLNISSLATAHPELLSRISFQTSDYNIFIPEPATVDASLRLDALSKLGTDFALITRAQADLQYLRENLDEFGPFRMTTLTSRLTALNAEQGNLWQFGKPCIERATAENCQAILSRPPVAIPQIRRVVEMGPNPNQLGTQSVCLLRSGEYARITGNGGWYVSERRDQDYFRPIGAGVANALLLPGQGATDLSHPRDAGPGGEVQFRIIDCCPGDNAATSNFSVRCAFLPFAEDKDNV